VSVSDSVCVQKCLSVHSIDISRDYSIIARIKGLLGYYIQKSRATSPSGLSSCSLLFIVDSLNKSYFYILRYFSLAVLHDGLAMSTV